MGDASQVRLDDSEWNAPLGKFINAIEFETRAFDCCTRLTIQMTAIVDQFPQRIQPVLPGHHWLLSTPDVLEDEQPTLWSKYPVRLAQRRGGIGNAAERERTHHRVKRSIRKWEFLRSSVDELNPQAELAGLAMRPIQHASVRIEQHNVCNPIRQRRKLRQVCSGTGAYVEHSAPRVT
jgi:hypothetical protein